MAKIMPQDLNEWLKYPLIAWPFILYYRWLNELAVKIEDHLA